MRARPFLFSLLIGTALGVLFASFYAVAQPERALRILAGGALTGICISNCITLLERLLDRRVIERLPQRWQLPAKALEFLIGGLAGWLVGMSLSAAIFGFGIPFRVLIRGNWAFSTAITGTITVVVGLSFYAYELLQRRLERTMEQLKQREWAEKELELARAIQTRLLPPMEIDGEGFTVAARNLPAEFVAGDFYDVVPLEDGSVVIVVADVAGKGIGASLIMASVKAVLPFVAREGAERAMAILNEKLVHELGRREFVALAYARLQPHDGTLELVNAGFPEPYVVSSRGVRPLASSGERLPLGLKANAAYVVLKTRLEADERLVFVSDGITEAPVKGEPLGYERTEAILRECAAGGFPTGEGALQTTRSSIVAAWLDGFLDRVRASVDDGLSDDWTAVVVQRA
ncbi:MAG TPA: SpoIIE family protein phosphatase [Thermoanaerobaculia bacterium]|jgi:hypothetical protein